MTDTREAAAHGLEHRVGVLESRVANLADMEARIRQLEAELESLRARVEGPKEPLWVDSGTVHPDLDDQTIAPPG